MNKVKIQTSAYACPSEGSCHLHVERIIFHVGGQRKKKKNPRNLLANAVKGQVLSCFACSGGSYRAALAEGSGKGNCWLSSLIPFPIHCKARSQKSKAFPPSNPCSHHQNLASSHTPVTSWQSPHALCNSVREGTAHLQLQFNHTPRYSFLLLAKHVPNPCRSGHKRAETALKKHWALPNRSQSLSAEFVLSNSHSEELTDLEVPKLEAVLVSGRKAQKSSGIGSLAHPMSREYIETGKHSSFLETVF